MKMKTLSTILSRIGWLMGVGGIAVYLIIYGNPTWPLFIAITGLIIVFIGLGVEPKVYREHLEK